LSLNRYSHVENNPATLSDPSGRCIQSWALAVAGPGGAVVGFTISGACVAGVLLTAAAGILGPLLGEVVSQASPLPQTPTDNWSFAPKVKRIDLEREIKKAGWTLKPGSGRGGHDVFVKDNYPDISLPRHREISPGVAGKIRKTLGGSGGAGSAGSGILQSSGSNVLGKNSR